VFFIIGVGLFALGKIAALRYYWFRLPDVMLPLAVSVVVAFIAENLVSGQGRLGRLIGGPGLRRALVGVIFLAALVSAGSYRAGKIRHDLKADRAAGQILPMLSWIQENTPREAIFLIDPTLDKFYVYAERAQFVSVKHAPYQPGDELEWYKRILLCNQGQRPEKNGFEAYPELSINYNRLSGEQIRAIAEEYGIDYYLSKERGDLGLERVHGEGGYSLYRIPGGEFNHQAYVAPFVAKALKDYRKLRSPGGTESRVIRLAPRA